jgi:hypothetical protein
MKGNQEIEFQEMETGDKNCCFQNCSGDQKGNSGHKGSLFQGFFSLTYLNLTNPQPNLAP